jgi:hypothetical protein
MGRDNQAFVQSLDHGQRQRALATLTQYADALGYKLEIRLIRKPRSTGHSTSRVIQAAPKRAAA